MKGSKKVIDALNEVLTAELTGINQYFLHAKMCGNWGYGGLHDKTYQAAIGEMKHANTLIERILFLDGVPNVQRLGKLSIGERVAEQLRLDLALELDAIKRLNKTIALCNEAGDHGTRDLLDPILRSEEEHLEWLEAQLNLIKQVGEAQYLARQIRAAR
jgi:bacterioferritin